MNKHWLYGFFVMALISIALFAAGTRFGVYLEQKAAAEEARASVFLSSAIEYGDPDTWSYDDAHTADVVVKEYLRISLEHKDGAFAGTEGGLVSQFGTYGPEKSPFVVLSVTRCGGGREIELYVPVRAVTRVAQGYPDEDPEQALKDAASVAIWYLWEKANPSVVSTWW